MGRLRRMLPLLALAGSIWIGQGDEHPRLVLKPGSDGTVIEAHVQTAAGYHIETSTNTQAWAHLFEGVAQADLVSHVDTYSSQFPNRFYRLTVYPAPPNDSFEDAQILEGSAVCVKGANYSASSQAGEPQHAILNSGGKSLWYNWKAPDDAHVVVEVINSYFDTLLAVYTGTDLATLQPVVKQIYATKLIHFEAKSGENYYLAVDGAGGQSGAFQLNLTAYPLQAKVPVGLGGTVLDMVDYQNPWDSSLRLRISNDGSKWELHRNKRPYLNGEIRSASLAGNVWTMVFAPDFESELAGDLNFSLNFRTSTSGEFEASSPYFSGKGKFSHLRFVENSLAPASLDDLHLTTIRTFTSTGPVGQAHYYTFAGNRFHDANNEEHALGTYSYRKDGNEAWLVNDYTGPGDFIGDHHEMRLRFDTPWEGEFTSTYLRNDGVVITINGTFEFN